MIVSVVAVVVLVVVAVAVEVAVAAVAVVGTTVHDVELSGARSSPAMLK